jgi:hypothetical protein
MKKLIQTANELTLRGDDFIRKHGSEEFHLEAGKLLLNSQIADSFDYQELVEESMRPGLNKIQNFNSFEFSDLPITLSRGESCFVDIYFWRRRPTVIHNHHFTGAFQCLMGANLDLEFVFKYKQELGQYHHMGELTLVKSRKLSKGDVAAIAFMDKFIHQNHHLADLTVNLCLRTPEVRDKNIANYLYSGLRYEQDNILLARGRRLLQLIGLGQFGHENLTIDRDDAICFLIQTFATTSQNPRLLEFVDTLSQRIKSELSIDVIKLLIDHERELDRIEDLYD